MVPLKPSLNPREIPSKIKKLQFLKLSITAIIGLVLFIILFNQIIRILIKYSEGPTYISTLVARQRDAEFPAITMCPNEEMYNLTRLREHGINSTDNYNGGAVRDATRTWLSNQSNTSPRALFDYITFSAKDLIRTVKVRTFEAHPERGFLVYLNVSSSTIKKNPHLKFGKCWTIYPDKWIRDLGIYYMMFQLQLPVEIYLHQMGQFLDLSGRMGYKVVIGERHESQISYRDMRMLEKPDKGEGSFVCRTINYDHCMYQRITDLMVDQLGCVSPWVKNTSFEICKESTKMNASFWITYQRITNQESDCPNPCNFLLISVGDKNVLLRNGSKYAYIFYYFAPRVTISKENYLYSGLSVFAEIGGYMGLLMGISLFNSAEWIGNIIQNKINKYKTKN
ncbi:uncharacterized protein [Lepeophtheirus salmonis]|nr:uncharacterized protein LOC121125809 isoform X2 [Lepeophtheirus salmonis]